MILQVDCKGALDLTYGWNISRLTKHVSVQTCFLCELKEVHLLCIWLSTNGRYVYEKHITMFISLSLMYHHDDNDDDENCHQYHHKVLDISHITITYSPGEGVGTGQLWELATNQYMGRIGRQNIGQNIVWCSLMCLMPLRSLSNCDYEL